MGFVKCVLVPSLFLYKSALCPFGSQGLFSSISFKIPLSSDVKQMTTRVCMCWEGELAFVQHLLCATHFTVLSHFTAQGKSLLISNQDMTPPAFK